MKTAQPAKIQVDKDAERNPFGTNLEKMFLYINIALCVIFSHYFYLMF